MLIPYLQVDGLTKSFGDLVLFSGISFGVAQGQRVGLIARNGAGKSTLLDVLAGIEGHDAGSIVYKNDLRVGYLRQHIRCEYRHSGRSTACQKHCAEY